MVLHAVQREAALRGRARGIDEDCRAGQGRVRPHVSPHEVLRLIAAVPALGERRRRDDRGGVLRLQREINELEVRLVVLRADVLGGRSLASAVRAIHDFGKPNSIISMLTNASKAALNWITW